MSRETERESEAQAEPESLISHIKPSLKEKTCGNAIYLAAHFTLRKPLFSQNPLRLTRGEAFVYELKGKAGCACDLLRRLYNTLGLRAVLPRQGLRTAADEHLRLVIFDDIAE